MTQTTDTSSMQEQLIEEILKEFEEKFVGKIQVPSNTTAIKYESSGIWKEAPWGGYETMTQPYQVAEFFRNALSTIASKSAEAEREKIDFELSREFTPEVAFHIHQFLYPKKDQQWKQ